MRSNAYGDGRVATCGLASVPSPSKHGEQQVSENDPADHAFAAIARFIDKPDVLDKEDVEATADSETSEIDVTSEPAEETAAIMPDAPDPSPDSEPAETYTKYGPGPLTAVRFKWTARCDDNGDYFVDETIGKSSYPLVSGPMTKEAAIKFVDDRERDAHQRFEALRSDMAVGEIGRRAGE